MHSKAVLARHQPINRGWRAPPNTGASLATWRSLAAGRGPRQQGLPVLLPILDGVLHVSRHLGVQAAPVAQQEQQLKPHKQRRQHQALQTVAGGEGNAGNTPVRGWHQSIKRQIQWLAVPANELAPAAAQGPPQKPRPLAPAAAAAAAPAGGAHALSRCHTHLEEGVEQGGPAVLSHLVPKHNLSKPGEEVQAEGPGPGDRHRQAEPIGQAPQRHRDQACGQASREDAGRGLTG